MLPYSIKIVSYLSLPFPLALNYLYHLFLHIEINAYLWKDLDIHYIIIIIQPRFVSTAGYRPPEDLSIFFYLTLLQPNLLKCHVTYRRVAECVFPSPSFKNRLCSFRSPATCPVHLNVIYLFRILLPKYISVLANGASKMGLC